MKRLAFVLLMLVALVSLLAGACGGGEEQGEATPTPTPTSTATATATPTHTATPTPTATPTSGNALSDIAYANVGDFQCDQIMTGSGQQPMTSHLWFKDAWLVDKMKTKTEMTTGGYTSVTIMDYSTRTIYTISQGTCFKTTWQEGTEDDVENADEIYPTYIGTDTIDGKLCDVYQWTYQDTTTKGWIWKDKKFAIKSEVTSSEGTFTVEYKNIVFGTLSNDLFQPPADCGTMPTYP